MHENHADPRSGRRGAVGAGPCDPGASLKEIVNEALRRGLKPMAEPAKPIEPFRTTTVSLGRCLIGDVDNIAEFLAVAEGEGFR